MLPHAIRGRELAKLGAGGSEHGETEHGLKSRNFTSKLYKAIEPLPAGLGYQSLLTQETFHPAWYIHPETHEILFPFLSFWNGQQT